MPLAPSPGGVRVERVVTSGVFELDGGSWEVDNNVWLVGDDTEVYRNYLSKVEFVVEPMLDAVNTHAKASTTFDFPEPLGPTMAVMPGSKFSVVAEANDLNPLSARLLRYTLS